MPNQQTATGPTLVEILAFERTHHGFGPGKTDVIRAELGITEVRYYILLDRAIDDKTATQSDPVFARQLREKRDRAFSGRASILRHT